MPRSAAFRRERCPKTSQKSLQNPSKALPNSHLNFRRVPHGPQNQFLVIFGKFFSGCNLAADTLKSKTSFLEIRFGCKHHEMDHLAIKAHWPPEGHSAEDEISLTIRADQRNQPEEMHAFFMRQLQLLPPFISSEYFQSRPL